MAIYGGPRADSGLQALFDASPESRAHTSSAAELAFLSGLVAVLSAPFAILFWIAALCGVFAAVSGLTGLVTTRRPEVAGSALAAFGTCLGLLAIALVSVRYAGVDTAFGDAVAPWIGQQLERLNGYLPQPR